MLILSLDSEVLTVVGDDHHESTVSNFKNSKSAHASIPIPNGLGKLFYVVVQNTVL